MTIHLKDDHSSRWDLLQPILRRSTKIGDYVGHLILIGATHTWYRQQNGHLAMLFPLVIQFEIKNSSWMDADNKYTTILAPGLKSVTRLLFTNCDTLVLNYSGASHDSRTIISRVPSIRTLHLGVGDETVFIDWILSNFQPLKITSLTLHWVTHQDSLAIGELTRALGDGLQHLDISFEIAPTVTEVAENIDLRHNTELRTLVFNDWFMSRWVPADWSVLMLKRVKSRKLRTLTFRFRCPNIEQLPWDDTAPFLNRIPFPELQLVRFENLALITDTLRDQRYIHNRLPALMVKNLLEYATVPERMIKFPWNLLNEGVDWLFHLLRLTRSQTKGCQGAYSHTYINELVLIEIALELGNTVCC